MRIHAMNPCGALLFGTILVLAGCAERSVQPKWDMSEKDLPGIQPHIDFVDSAGRQIPPEAIARFTGTVTWTIEDQQGVPKQAATLVDMGMQAGGSDQLERAMACFREAHIMAPRWAQPVYQGAWTALLLGDAALAETLYTWTDRMVPSGYWTAKTAVDCLHRERTGEFPSGTYMRYVKLEGESHPRRAQLLEQIVARVPSFAPAWKDLAVLRESPEGQADAIERGLAARPDQETRAFLLIHKAEALRDRGAKDEATQLLTGLLDPGSGTMQTMALARIELARAEEH